MTTKNMTGEMSGHRGEELCIHGVGHGSHVHGCDGCCSQEGTEFAQLFTAPNYEHHSHSHCWNQGGQPACGIPLEKHTQCCLCDLKESDEKKCTHEGDHELDCDPSSNGSCKNQIHCTHCDGDEQPTPKEAGEKPLEHTKSDYECGFKDGEEKAYEDMKRIYDNAKDSPAVFALVTAEILLKVLNNIDTSGIQSRLEELKSNN